MLDNAQQVLEEAVLGDVDAEELGHLVEHDHETDAGLESGEHRGGNEVGNESETGDPGEHQHRADEGGQGRGGGDELGRVAVGNDDGEPGAGEDRERRRRADAQHPRGSQDRVDDHRDEGGVEAHRHRQSGNGGVGHRLRQDDGGRREAGDDVEAQGAGGSRWALVRMRFDGHASFPRLQQI
jgi:hypothetical protein